MTVQHTDPATAEDRALDVIVDIAQERCDIVGHEHDWECALLQRSIVTVKKALSELEAAQARLDKAMEFIDQRREVITALRNAGTGSQENGDYDRWQGHAEARRVLAEALGIDLDKDTGGIARALGLGEEAGE